MECLQERSAGFSLRGALFQVLVDNQEDYVHLFMKKVELRRFLDQPRLTLLYNEVFIIRCTLFYATADEADAYVLQMFFFVFFLFFFRPSQKNTDSRSIFVKFLPNDTGENGVSNVVPPPGE